MNPAVIKRPGASFETVSRATFLPLGINVAGLRCLVVGGGRVGARKALTLAAAGADVTVLSPHAGDRLRGPIGEGTVKWVEEEYSRQRLRDFFLVVAATSDADLNARIAHDAETGGSLACVVSSGRLSRAIFPATHSGAGVTLAVHSNGIDCRRSSAVRDRLARLVDDDPLAGASKLCVLSVRRGCVPDALFRQAQSVLPPATRRHAMAEGIWLVTCQRVECYFRAPSPWPVVERVLARASQAGLEDALRAAAVVRHGTAAYHHLVRVASGLDSLLPGEAEIAGQIRAAARTPVPRSLPASDDVSAALKAQRQVRKASGLRVCGWAQATVRLLRERLSALAGRSVAVVGCGRLGEAITGRLLAEGAAVQLFSRRADAGSADWWHKSGLTAFAQSALTDALPGLDALALTAPLSVQARARVQEFAAGGRLPVVDLEGSSAPPAHVERGAYFGLREVAGMPLGGAGAARVARAEALAFEQALRRHGPASWTGRLIRLGTRGSRLALAQAEELCVYLRILLPDARLEVLELTTPGDRDKSTPLPEVRDEDFFTRDLDLALLRGEVDMAVHSAKDLPARVPKGLRVAAVTPSPAPWECLVSHTGEALSRLAAGARVGTSSARRRDSLLALRPDVVPCDVRGDVPDRLRQLDEGRYDALILAAVGLIRLGLHERISEIFPLTLLPPPAGQGSLAVLVREDDDAFAQLLAPLDIGSREGLPSALE